MDYLLYKIPPGSEPTEEAGQPNVPGECVTFSPFSVRWFVPMFRAGGIEFVKVVLLATWTVAAGAASRADIKIWAFVGTNGGILHYSVVTPTAMHLPWLPQADVGDEIGGCITVPDARGMRIYPHVLQQVTAANDYERPLYMIVESANKASRSGMERAGFEVACAVERERRFFGPPVFAPLDG